MRVSPISCAVLIIITVVLPVPLDAQMDNCVIMPHMETQLLLREIRRTEFGTPQYWEKFTELDKIAVADGPRFVRQLILHEVTENTIEPLAFLAYEFRVTRTDIAEGIATLIYCDNEHIRSTAREIFQSLLREQRDAHRPFELDLSDWSPFESKPEIAKPLTRALFEIFPVNGFYAYARELYLLQPERDRREIRRHLQNMRIADNALFQKNWLGGIPGGKVDSQTLTALRELSQSKYWWSRLFVAEIMVQNKEFRDSEIIERLANDPNDLVRGSIASLTNPDPLRFTGVDR